MTKQPWWKTGVVYQIYPRSFCDGDGDGVGDIPGIHSRLDYLERLGVDALWLSPVYPSPQADFGYDISDYCGVDSLFGSLDDMKRLIGDAHDRGMRVVMDWVVNHCSDKHPWFQAARASKENDKRDWFIWHEGVGGKPPNNWASTFGGPAWTLDAATGEFYLHTFLPEQPDLNWRNPDVVEAVLDGMRFWMDLGIDGFRLDVFNCYYKDEKLRSNQRNWNPAGLVYGYIGQEHVYDRDRPEMDGALAKMRAVVDSYEGGMLVGETMDERFRYDKAAGYCGDGKLNMAFNFRLLHSRWSSRSFGEAIRTWVDSLPRSGWPSWVLSNHDFPRHATRWAKGNPDERAKLAAILAITLKGTPFLYYGEELGMVEGRLSRSEIVDPPGKRFWPVFKGRDGCRTPMQWDDGKKAGFTTGTPWLPINPDSRDRNVEAQEANEGSVLATYKALIALRKQHPALQIGTMSLPAEDHPKVLTWTREHEGETLRIVLNMAPIDVPFRRPERGRYRVLFSTHADADPGESGPIDLRPHQGLVLAVER